MSREGSGSNWVRTTLWFAINKNYALSKCQYKCEVVARLARKPCFTWESFGDNLLNWINRRSLVTVLCRCFPSKEEAPNCKATAALHVGFVTVCEVGNGIGNLCGTLLLDPYCPTHAFYGVVSLQFMAFKVLFGLTTSRLRSGKSKPVKLLATIPFHDLPYNASKSTNIGQFISNHGCV
jgi:hypothetical protein